MTEDIKELIQLTNRQVNCRIVENTQIDDDINQLKRRIFEKIGVIRKGIG